MGDPQIDPDVVESAPQKDGGALNSTVMTANASAQKFLKEVKAIEVGLETENIQLQSQITGYELTVRILSGQIDALKKELANKSDCDEDEFNANPESPKVLANEIAPTMNKDGTPS